jgi:site-specific DNA-methyltransferase (adenine-specific)/site-specific DNA-methyltransferase (cytosine-N4-specific)
MADEIRTVPIEEIEDDPNNTNLGTDRGNAMVRASYDKFGHLESGVIDRNGKLIGGEKRKNAAIAVGITKAKIVPIGPDEILVGQRMDLDVSSPEGMEASQILNRSAVVSINIDVAAVRANVTEGMDLSLMYSSNEELKLGLSQRQEDITDLPDSPTFSDDPSTADATEGGEAEDELDESTDSALPPSLATAGENIEADDYDVQEGDIWKAGDQWIFCGDCRDTARVLPFIGINGFDAAITSPPYAMQKNKQYGGIAEEKYVDWFADVQAAIRDVTNEQANFILNIKAHSSNFQRSLYVIDLVLDLVRNRGWHFIDELCWRHGGIPGHPKKMGKFKNQWEPVYWFTKSMIEGSPPYPFYPEHVMVPSKHIIQDDRFEGGVAQEHQGVKSTFQGRTIGPGMAYPGNVLYGRSNKLYGHEAVFPIELPAFFIASMTKEGDSVLDPFGGAGTTAIAAQNLGRKSLMVEIMPKYVEIFLKRFQETFDIQPEYLDNVGK